MIYLVSEVVNGGLVLLLICSIILQSFVIYSILEIARKPWEGKELLAERI